MNLDAYSFNRGALKPMACLREGWQIIKGEYWLFFGVTVLGLFVASMAALILMGPLMCGIHYCYFRKERGQHVSVDMLFRGFDYFAPSLVATLIVMLIMMVPSLVFVLGSYAVFFGALFAVINALPEDARNAPPDPMMFVGPFALLIGCMVLGSLFMGLLRAFFLFTYPLIVDRKLSGTDAVKLSARAVAGNLMGAIGLILLIEMLMFVGALACYIGMIFALPLTFAMISVAYRQVFERERLPSEEMLDDDADLVPMAGPPETGIQGAPNTAVTPQPPE